MEAKALTRRVGGFFLANNGSSRYPAGYFAWYADGSVRAPMYVGLFYRTVPYEACCANQVEFVRRGRHIVLFHRFAGLVR